MAKPDKAIGKGGGRDKGTKDTSNEIMGTTEDDTLVGTLEADTIFGDAGNDVLLGDAGNDTLDGGAGSDTYVVSGSDGVNNYTDSGVASSDGGTAALTADASADWDVIQADYHGTAIYMNTFDANSGIEEISANGWGNVSIRGTGGNDVLDFSETKLTGIAYIDGSGGDDTITGSKGDDNILGGIGDDTLSGGGGDDNFYGGSGKDTYVLDADGLDSIHDFDPEEDTLDLSGLDLSDGGIETAQDEDGNSILSVGGIPVVMIHDTLVDDLVFDEPDEIGALELF